MSVSQAWRSADLTPEQLEALYQPILLEDALHKAATFPTYPHESDNQSAGTYQAEMEDLEAFRFYVNKLAQVCDNERGGDTVSAIAILRGSAGPNYVIGSNFRDPGDLQMTKDFMQVLLDLMGKNPDKLQPKALRSRVLWFILSFNIPRLQEYLQHLSQAVQECRESCERREEVEGRSISDCETLIKAIYTLDQTEISQRAKDAEMTRSEPWCKLRHYLGRWLSYRKAAEGIVTVSERWPDLFLDFEITMVPPGSRLQKPNLPSGLTSSIIIQQIVAEDKSQDPDLNELADSLEQMGIDEIIQKSQQSRKFRPRLHAEGLVYEYLSTNGQTAAESYWNRWSYIGSSKPTCRLCHYYFDALQDDKPAIRSSHYNLYRDWRLPEHHDAETRDELLKKIVQRLRADVIKTLKEKKLRRKAKDSNTYSSFPEGLRMKDHTPGSTDSDDPESPDSTGSQDTSAGELEAVTSPID
ncbi:uncharacterized protein B0J16DRAFT_267046 [Fusarium flagelliforme]|uniref:uncharacterized protein n=1 Tax=Fusarium flagelliforme TaxID=2675880 RepID=UPI001E8D5BD9|nr:uncharacterized protein B0J16DRAFT_267046 [Fusarium flagelliforme]KAH7184568.1 hypothetical protein B0J16DRAFT_267046 [Fusarium flagelliforme]